MDMDRFTRFFRSQWSMQGYSVGENILIKQSKPEVIFLFVVDEEIRSHIQGFSFSQSYFCFCTC